MKLCPLHAALNKSARQKYLTQDEFERLLKTTTKPRDWLLLFLTGNLGLRVSEVVRLRVQDFDWLGGYVRVPTLKQEGHRGIHKGSILRGELPATYEDIPAPEELLSIVKVYIGIRKTGWLFLATNGQHIDALTGRRAFKHWAKKAGLLPVYSIHCLRHYRGVSVYKEYRDIYAVKTLLRHKNIGSSQVYVAMDLDDKRNLTSKLPVVGLNKGGK